MADTNGNTEGNGKVEIEYHAGETDIPNTKRLVTNIGVAKGSKVKYEVYFLIPDNDAEAQERYDCKLADLVSAGVRSFSTRPDYPSVGFNEDGTLKPEGHKAMQTLADGYKPGQRATAGPNQKLKAKEFDKLAEAAAAKGLDMEKVMAMINKAKK